MPQLSLTVLSSEFSIHRLDPDESIPVAVLKSGLFWIGRTDHELSIVCRSGVAVPGSRVDAGWSCLKVEGPLDPGLTGVLAGLSAALAAAQVSMLALSTYDTDYLLVKSRDLAKATAALAAAGYNVEPKHRGP